MSNEIEQLQQATGQQPHITRQEDNEFKVQGQINSLPQVPINLNNEPQTPAQIESSQLDLPQTNLPQAHIAQNDTMISQSPLINDDQNNKSPQEQVIVVEANLQPSTPKKAVVTQTIKLNDDLNIFDWFKPSDIINQIAEKAKSSVDSVITTLDPGMKEYLFSGGDINIIVLSYSTTHLGPIRDAFQFVFGRATVSQTQISCNYPIKLARGTSAALQVAANRIRDLRLDTSNIPQNQVVIALQPTIIPIAAGSADSRLDNMSNTEHNHESVQWFFSYAMIIEDPVQNLSLNCFSQFIPIDQETISILDDTELPAEFSDKNLGFAQSIDELMKNELKLSVQEQDEPSVWMKIWAGVDELKLVHDLGLTLANAYKRKWNSNFRLTIN